MITKDFVRQLSNPEGRVAFATGAGSGIDQIIVCALISTSVHTICFDLCEGDGPDATVGVITAIGAQTTLYTDNVRQLSDLRTTATLTKEHLGRLGVTVNAADIANTNPALEMESEQWQRVTDISLTNMWSSCKVEAEPILKSGGGLVINITPTSGIIINRGLEQIHYNSAKAEVVHLSKSLAVEQIGKEIRMNSISPGYTTTLMNIQPEMVHQTWGFESQMPIQRMTKAEEMAGPALLLTSDTASFCTDVDLVVDDGSTCW